MIAGLVLAAGASRRMGTSKLLLPWGEGSTILEAVVDVLRQGGLDPLIVVVGAEREGLEAALQGSGALIVANPQPEAGGMLGSVKIGLAAMPVEATAAGIMPADLPRVRAETVRALARASEAAPDVLVAPVHAGRRGHPVLIPRRFWGEIGELPAGETLRTFLQRHAQEIANIEVADPGIRADIDTPEDYQAAGGSR